MIYAVVPGLGDISVRTEGEVALAPGDEIGLTPQQGREHRFAG